MSKNDILKKYVKELIIATSPFEFSWSTSNALTI